MKKIFRIGTRGSPLALIQAELVRASLLKAHPTLKETHIIELVPIRTNGDWRPEMAERTLSELGANKGLFTKEIDEALLSGYIDVAVHSMKDMASVLPQGAEITAVLERADPRDAFLSLDKKPLTEMPQGAVIGTASLRRKAQLLAYRPDLQIIPLRGNVETRLQKLADGTASATLLAKAGLDRLGIAKKITHVIETDLMLPAVAQGAIAAVVLSRNEDAVAHVRALNHAVSEACVSAERAMLAVLDGSCRTPIGGFARMASDQLLLLEGMAAYPDGTGCVRMQLSGPAADAEKLGQELGAQIRAKLPEDFYNGLS